MAHTVTNRPCPYTEPFSHVMTVQIPFMKRGLYASCKHLRGCGTSPYRECRVLLARTGCCSAGPASVAGGGASDGAGGSVRAYDPAAEDAAQGGDVPAMALAP